MIQEYKYLQVASSEQRHDFAQLTMLNGLENNLSVRQTLSCCAHVIAGAIVAVGSTPEEQEELLQEILTYTRQLMEHFNEKRPRAIATLNLLEALATGILKGGK